jgi:4-hydroxy-tetrahydrodipicolinate reductase
MAISLCVVGATGRFGRSIIAQAPSDVEIAGAVCSDGNPLIGKRLSELGVHNSEAVLKGASDIEDAVAQSSVVIFVSKPAADLANIPRVVSKGRRIVVGTTGFTPSQNEHLSSLLRNVPSIVASNFSVGANLLFQITKLVSRFGKLYDYSVVEHHHKMKVDAPSGTAKRMVELLNSQSAFPVTVTDRTSQPKRMEGEIELASLRGGGTPGIHQLILAGEHEIIRIEHLAFSRAASATGAILACKWIATKEQPGIYSMEDVLTSADT